MAFEPFKRGFTGSKELNKRLTELDAALRDEVESLLPAEVAEQLPAVVAAAKIYTATVAVENSTPEDGTANITGQVIDGNEDPVTGRHVIKVWLSATANSAPVDLGELTAKANTVILSEQVTDGFAEILTHSDGSYGLELATDTAGSVYCNVVYVGPVASDDAAIAGNE